MGAQYGHTLTQTYAPQFGHIEVTHVTDSEIALYWLKYKKKLNFQ